MSTTTAPAPAPGPGGGPPPGGAPPAAAHPNPWIGGGTGTDTWWVGGSNRQAQRRTLYYSLHPVGKDRNNHTTTTLSKESRPIG